MSAVDAIVIGAGPNGLVAAAILADAGWDVLVVEQQPEPGGAVRSAEIFPGFGTDLFSAFYPLAFASPVIRALELENHGLRWSHAPAVLGHARTPTDAVLMYPGAEQTADALGRHSPPDARRWLQLCQEWQSLREPLLDALLGSAFPPVHAGLRLRKALGTPALVRFARFLALPARRMAAELFASEQARLLLLGNAMHGDVAPDAAGSGVMGYLLTMLGQHGGYPVPAGGAGALTAALVSRCRAEILCNTQVSAIEVRDGRALAVRTADGQRVTARRAVIADVSAPALYERLLPAAVLPNRLRADLRRFEWDTPVVKVNYALSQPVPWRARELGQAGTVHLGADEAGLVRWAADLSTGVVPQRPFLLFGQMTTADPSRSPVGTESAWAYTHLPAGVTDDESAQTLARNVDAVLEEHAPGFAAAVTGRLVQTPGELSAADANLHGGAVAGGTAQLHQQLIFRPVPGLGGPETPVAGLFLGSAAAHPGGGVHGACGANAARAALRQRRPGALVRRTILRKVIHGM